MDSELIELVTDLSKYVLDSEYDDLSEMIGMDPDCYGVGLSAEELEQIDDLLRHSEEEIALIYKAARHSDCPHIFSTALRVMDKLNEDKDGRTLDKVKCNCTCGTAPDSCNNATSTQESKRRSGA